jgi:hypothetical protein
MGWVWRLESADGAVVTGPDSPVHPSQSDAESWLGESWRDLASRGVARVVLLSDGAEVYGPMSLAED